MKSKTVVLLLFSMLMPAFAGDVDVSKLKDQLKESRGTKTVDLLVNLAESAVKESPDLALEYCKRALVTANTLHYKKGEALAAFCMGRIYRNTEKYDSALSQLHASLKILLELKDTSRIAQCETEIGLAYFMKPDIESAVTHFKSALEIYSELKDRFGISVAYYNLGRCRRKSGELERALEYSLKSLEFNSENNHNALNTISIIYAMMGDPKKAFEYQINALKIREALGLSEEIIGSLNNLSVISKLRGRPDEGMYYLLKSLKKAEESGKKSLVSRALNNIGSFYEGTFQKLEEALNYFERSLKISGEINNKFEMANTLINIGSIQSKLKRPDLALKNLGKGVALAQEIKAEELIKNGFEMYYQHYERVKNFQKAFEFYQSFIKAKEAILTQQLNVKLSEMKIRHESENKKKENELLKLQIERGRFLKVGLIFMLISLSAFFLGLFYLLWNKNKLNKVLQKEISERKKIEAELESRVRHRTKELETEISVRKKTEEEVNMHRIHLEEMVKKRTVKLEKINAELERFQNATIDREFRMKELKNQVEELKKKLLKEK